MMEKIQVQDKSTKKKFHALTTFTLKHTRYSLITFLKIDFWFSSNFRI